MATTNFYFYRPPALENRNKTLKNITKMPLGGAIRFQAKIFYEQKKEQVLAVYLPLAVHFEKKIKKI